jgi:predicted dehydrogenase
MSHETVPMGNQPIERPLSLAVVGAGLVGKRHVAAIAETADAVLACIVDPSEDARVYAEETGAPWYPNLAAMIGEEGPDGVILATPNQLHVEHGLECVAAGIPMLVEKPIADDVASARQLVEAAERADVAILVGHHRRHNPLIQAARQSLASGAIGTVVAVHGMFWVYKPDDYFDVEWRRRPGAGPAFINLIHDIDLLRHLCGEILWLQALESNAVRGNQVEDSAAILVRFQNGALGTINLSDTIVSPWSWELTAGENPAYSPTGESCYWIGGTHGSLELPNARLWRNRGTRSWWEPIDPEPLRVDHEDPLVRQARHFCRVIKGREQPLVSGREGLKTLQVVEAVKRSARTGKPVTLSR